ncbi:hypothetical protein IX51_11425 [uncultured archaeon]|nr:hypothetical protein IX51_11425 [uncultured archaeon]
MPFERMMPENAFSGVCVDLRGLTNQTKVFSLSLLQNYMTSVSLILSIISLTVSVVLVLIAYFDLRLKIKHEKDVAEGIMEYLKVVKKQNNLLQKALKRSNLPNEDIEREKIAIRKEELAWRKLKDIAKGAKWILEDGEYDD